MREFVQIAKTLSDENRVRILMFLSQGELCLCQVIDLLGLAPSTVSKHMALLEQAGLVDHRKDGRWHYYRLSVPSPSPAAAGALAWIRETLETNSKAQDDRRRLLAVMRKDKEELCCHYNR